MHEMMTNNNLEALLKKSSGLEVVGVCPFLFMKLLVGVSSILLRLVCKLEITKKIKKIPKLRSKPA